MKSKLFLSLTMLLGIPFLKCYAVEPPVHSSNQEKTAIILVTFGTSVKKAQVAFDNIKNIAEKRFPKDKIVWAYTSVIIRKKLAKQGVFLDSPEEAINKLEKAGYNRIILQSLHTISGYEYEEITKLKSKYKNIVVGAPLLSSYKDLTNVLKAVLETVPDSRKSDEAIILIGHGSHHPAGLAYIAAAGELHKIDKNTFICCVESHPTFEEVISECTKNKIKKAYLIPFMSVAGNHAYNDIAGDGEDSLNTLLKKEGISSITIFKGTAENDLIVNIWLDHLEQALNSH